MEFKKLAFPEMTIERAEFQCAKHGKVLCECVIIGGEKKLFCPICEKEVEEEEQKQIAQKKAEQEQKDFEADKRAKNIEREYWGKGFDDYEVFSESQGKALEAVKRMVAERRGKVVLLGSNGCGKSMLGSIAVDKLGGKILSMYEITTMIRQSYTVKAERTELEIVTELAEIPMLVIDEVGRTKGSVAEMNWLSYILDKRHSRGLPFMLLTNTHLKKNCKCGGCERCFENFVDSDILSRLRQSRIITIVDAPDYRAEGGKK